MTPTPDEMASVILRLAERITQLEQEIVVLAGQLSVVQRHLAGEDETDSADFKCDPARWEELKRKAY